MTFEDINIVYEDNQLLVVVKPRGLCVAPDESGDENLLDLLKQYLVVSKNKPGKAYLGMVHRLDRPAGGVMVFAKTTKAADRLSNAIKNHLVEKRYLAVTEGVPREKESQLVNYLLKNNEMNKVLSVPMATENAKKAVLTYKVLDDIENRALVDINLETGRAHQIRVQMSNIGCPLMGDHKYGNARGKCELALWSYMLRFEHPVTREKMSFLVYPPEELPFSAFDITRFLAITIKNNR